MFCHGFIKTRSTFRCDLQSSFEENAKEMRYCNAKLNVISDVLRDGVGGLSKTITNCKYNTFNWPNTSELIGYNQVYRQFKFEYVCQKRYQVMRKAHVILIIPRILRCSFNFTVTAMTE